MDNTPPPAPMYNAPAQPPKASGLGIAGMVLGIVSLVLCFVPCIPFLGIILAIVGLVLSLIGMKAPKKGMAIAGAICSGISLILNVAWIFLFAAAAAL